MPYEKNIQIGLRSSGKDTKKVLHNVIVYVISEGTTVARLTGNSQKPECRRRGIIRIRRVY